MIEDGGNYGDFLLKTIEGAKDQFTADELKILKDGAEAADVTIRCYLLSECIAEALEEIEEDFNKAHEE